MLWLAMVNPVATFVKNYFFRRGFLDGLEGLVYHLNHSVYIHWKYVKAWDAQKRLTIAVGPTEKDKP
jgi:hypothetical protein